MQSINSVPKKPPTLNTENIENLSNKMSNISQYKQNIKNTLSKVGNDKITSIKKLSGSIIPKTSSLIVIGVLILLTILLLTIGILNLNIYQDCNQDGKNKSLINYYASIISVGLGVGVLAYLIFDFTFKWYDKLPLILLSIVLIGIAATNIYFNNKDQYDKENAVNTGVLGVGLGLTIGFGLLLMNFIPTFIRMRVIGILLTIAVIIFSIFGINIYQKCDKPKDSKSSLIALAILLTLGLLSLIGLVASFFI